MPSQPYHVQPYQQYQTPQQPPVIPLTDDSLNSSAIIELDNEEVKDSIAEKKIPSIYQVLKLDHSEKSGCMTAD